MPPNLHLALHDVIGVFSVFIIIVMGFFVLLKDHRKTVNVTLGLTFFGAIVGIVSYIIGVSIADPVLSRSILLWNVSIIFVSAVNFHCAMAIMNKNKSRLALILTVYAVSALFIALFLLYPDTFMGMPVPKMYFPNYFTPGPLQWIFNLLFKILIPAYFISELLKASIHSVNSLEKKRYIYFALSFLLGWLVGFIPTFLTYGIRFDPIWGMLFPVVFAVPFLYAVVHYELLDIKIIAKKALAYAGIVIGVGLAIGLFDFVNEWLRYRNPDFPIWAMPLILAIIAVGAGVLIWRQLRESEILKYEFITTVTHKFRTPLTHIRWATENLKAAATDGANSASADQNEQIGYIEDASSKLVELTDLLANASEGEDFFRYRLEKSDLSAFAQEMVKNLRRHANAKKINIIEDIEPAVMAVFDATRLRFVLQTFIENAINYTAEGGEVRVTVKKSGSEATCSVRDTGIGIQKQDIPRIATKLYRGDRARNTDTEGMGIGLFISKGIIERHRGRLIVESEGENKGATFCFSLPVKK